MEGLAPDAGILASLGLSQGTGPNLSGIRSQEQAAAAAKEFEGFFVSQMLSSMFSGVKTPAPFGGGSGEESFQGLLMEEYGKLIAKSGGIGLSGPLQAEIMRLQEIA